MEWHWSFLPISWSTIFSQYEYLYAYVKKSLDDDIGNGLLVSSDQRSCGKDRHGQDR